MLKSSGVMIEAVSGGQITAISAILLMTVLFVAYGIAGGLNSSIYTDLVQGSLMIVLSFLIFPFALSKLGGMAGLRQAVANPEMFRIVTSGEITLFYILVVAFNALMGWFGSPIACSSPPARPISSAAWALSAAASSSGSHGGVDPDRTVCRRDLCGQENRCGSGLRPRWPATCCRKSSAGLAGAIHRGDAGVDDGGLQRADGLRFRPIRRKPLSADLLAARQSDRHYMTLGRVSSVAIVALAPFFSPATWRA